MKSLLKLLTGRRLTQHPDSFALTRATLWKSIAQSIKLQQSMGKAVWIVVYFPDTYLDCQTMLEQHRIDYHVETEAIDETRYLDSELTGSKKVGLFLADLLRPIQFESESPDSDSRIAIMVAERHPCGANNDDLIEFARSLPNKTEIGHFLAMDDELVRQMIPPQMVDLMRTMGLNDNDLISSSMVTRIIHRRIKQTQTISSESQSASSAAQWYELQSGE